MSLRAALAGAALGFAAGLAVGALVLGAGSASGGGGVAGPALAPGAAASRAEGSGLVAPSGSRDRPRAPGERAPDLRHAAVAAGGHGARPEEPPDAPAPRPPADLAGEIAKIASEEDGAGVAASDLVRRLRADPALVAAAIARFREETDPARLAALAAVLGRVRDPAVEALALELARPGGGDRAHRLAALDILDAFETPAAIPLVAGLLAEERDPLILSGAIHALPEPAGVALEAAIEIDRDLARLAERAPDVETRRRAVEKLGSWGVGGGEHDALLLRALRDDPDPEVRAAAAFAIEQRRAAPAVPAALEALAAAVARRDEDPQVRENAWQALRRAGPLPRNVRAVYEAYAAEREGRAVR